MVCKMWASGSGRRGASCSDQCCLGTRYMLVYAGVLARRVGCRESGGRRGDAGTEGGGDAEGGGLAGNGDGGTGEKRGSASARAWTRKAGGPPNLANPRIRWQIGQTLDCRRARQVGVLSHKPRRAALRTRVPLNTRQKFSGMTAQYCIRSVLFSTAVATHRSPAASPADVPNPVSPASASKGSKFPLVAATPNSPR